jgi:hypothetical protein
MVGSARLYVCAHKTKRFIVAIKYAEEETYSRTREIRGGMCYQLNA